MVGRQNIRLARNHHVKRPLSSKPDDAFIPVYRQVLYDFVGWLATHLQPNQPYSPQVSDKPCDEAASEDWIQGHHAVFRMADFGLIERSHQLALAEVMFAAMPMF